MCNCNDKYKTSTELENVSNCYGRCESGIQVYHFIITFNQNPISTHVSKPRNRIPDTKFE